MADELDRLKAALADKYAIEREIGAGGMATVYLAEDLKHHRKVAVKVLRPDLAAALGPERFLREIEIAAGPWSTEPSRWRTCLRRHASALLSGAVNEVSTGLAVVCPVSAAASQPAI